MWSVPYKERGLMLAIAGYSIPLGRGIAGLGPFVLDLFDHFCLIICPLH